MQQHRDFDEACDEGCHCRLCEQPMKLIRRLPRMGAAPELLVFYCRDCNEVDSADWRHPSQHTLALN
jgi:ATP-dependent helicase YprA (DUF1998 family)